MEALSLNYTVSIPFAVFSLVSTLPPYWCKRSGIFFQYSPVLTTLETCSGKYVPSSAISQSISGRSLAATKSALTALPFTFTLWRLALALNRWNQPWLALKDALMLHCVSSSSLREGFRLSLESALSWVGLETDGDPASMHWKVSPSPPSLLQASFILLWTSLAQQTSHVPWLCPCSLESCQWLNDSCYKNKQQLPSFCLTLSIIFTFVSKSFLAVPATSPVLLHLLAYILGLK